MCDNDDMDSQTGWKMQNRAIEGAVKVEMQIEKKSNP
jgi:hypothetical protein